MDQATWSFMVAINSTSYNFMIIYQYQIEKVETKSKETKFVVKFIGDNSTASVTRDKMCSFEEGILNQYDSVKNKKLSLSVEEAKAMFDKKESASVKHHPPKEILKKEKAILVRTNLEEEKNKIGKAERAYILAQAKNLELNRFSKVKIINEDSQKDTQSGEANSNKLMTFLESNAELNKKSIKIGREYFQKICNINESVKDDDSNDNTDKSKINILNQVAHAVVKLQFLKSKRKRDEEELSEEENVLLEKITLYLNFTCQNYEDDLIENEKESLMKVISYFDEFKLPNPIDILKVIKII